MCHEVTELLPHSPPICMVRTGQESTCQFRGHRKTPHAAGQPIACAATTEPPRPEAHALQQEKPPQEAAWAPQGRAAPTRCNRESPHAATETPDSSKYIILEKIIIIISCFFSGLPWEPTQVHTSDHLKLDIIVPGKDLLMLAHSVLPKKSFRGLLWMDLLSLLPASGAMLFCTSCAPRMGSIPGPPGKYWQEPCDSLKDILLRSPFKREPAPKCTPLGSTTHDQTR